ncbi:hypothetical protein FOCC_FOCC014352 [Frankliniella occidentalis]|nr:hypothetical protein FOCC_FOCC014352 [Frankliniella occidentalis]
MFAVLVNTAEILYLDPLNRDINSSALSCADTMISILKTIKPTIPKWSLKVMSYCTQVDSVNCGVHICWFAYQIIMKFKEFTDLEDLIKYRQFIRETICGHCLERSGDREEALAMTRGYIGEVAAACGQSVRQVLRKMGLTIVSRWETSRAETPAVRRKGLQGEKLIWGVLTGRVKLSRRTPGVPCDFIGLSLFQPSKGHEGPREREPEKQKKKPELFVSSGQDEENIVEVARSDHVTAEFWGCIMGSVAVALTPTTARNNQIKYRDILRHQDNAPIHNAAYVRDWLANTQPYITVLRWPPYSPDLNPIENVWAAMVRDWDPQRERTVENLQQHFFTVWGILQRNRTIIENLTQSMP